MEQDVLFKYFSGKASAKEKAAVSEWLQTDPAAQKEFEQAHFLFECTTVHLRRRQSAIVKILRTTMKVAAVIALFMIGVVTAEQITVNKISKTRMSVRTLPGQRSTVTLSDGTIIELNSGTVLESPAVFNKKERKVLLNGEAMFHVAHDSQHPFIVSTFASDIKVVGTVFNVKAQEEDQIFTTILKEGCVVIKDKQENEIFTMHPNEVVSLIDGQMRKTMHNDPSDLCWLNGLVNLKANDFNELMNRIANAFGVELIMKNQNTPSVDGLNGEIRISDGIDHAMKALQHVINFDYTLNNNNKIITISDQKK